MYQIKHKYNSVNWLRVEVFKKKTRGKFKKYVSNTSLLIWSFEQNFNIIIILLKHNPFFLHFIKFNSIYLVS